MVQLESSVKDFITLLKPRVMMLVVFTAICGLYLAPGSIHPFYGTIAIISITLASGAAGAINMWYDRDIDIIMQRTQNRPIPLGKIVPEDALYLGIFLAIIAVSLIFLAVNALAAFLLAFTIFFYILIYTCWLKRSSPQNIVIGGVAGALPPLIGWVSVTNHIDLPAVIIFFIIFFWTPPHSWALALIKLEDYQNAKIPMMSVIHGVKHTKILMLLYTILLILTTSSLYFINFAHFFYLLSSSILNVVFIIFVILILNDQKNIYVGKFFRYSILYLFLIFLFLVMDKRFYL